MSPQLGIDNDNRASYQCGQGRHDEFRATHSTSLRRSASFARRRRVRNAWHASARAFPSASTSSDRHLPSGAHIVLSGIQLVLAGIGIGLLVAAPIGPVNVLCIQRAVAKGFWGGLAAGLGAMLGDGLLAAIAAFSMTAISDLMIAYSGPIQLFGGALLIVFGIGLLFARPMLAGRAGPEIASLGSLGHHPADLLPHHLQSRRHPRHARADRRPRLADRRSRHLSRGAAARRLGHGRKPVVVAWAVAS